MKVLIDTSAWIEHLKGSLDVVGEMLLDETLAILTHSMVIAELALGGVKKESEPMRIIETLPPITEVASAELLAFIESNEVANKGVGYVDCSLLASCVLEDAALLTMDSKLSKMAKTLFLPEL